MKITRDVILDLWPAYQAGEVSNDTRAFVDEFLASDPEFANILRKLGDPGKLLRDAPTGARAAAEEKRTMQHARSRVVAQWLMLAAAVMMTGMLVLLFMGAGLLLVRARGTVGLPELLVLLPTSAIVLGVAAALWWAFARLARG